MAAYKKQVALFETEQGAEIEQALRRMAADSAYNTESSYSANMAYPDNRIPFVEKHMQYLTTHQKVDPEQYLANLRLMTRIR